MNYMGGKTKQAKYIAAIIRQYHPDRCFVEPFMGACNITCAMEGYQRFAYDIDEGLVALFNQLVYKGWIPPQHVTEQEYNHVMNNPDEYDLAYQTFIAYGCSFGGKKWGGYARTTRTGKKIRNYALEGYKVLLNKRKCLQGVQFSVSDYQLIPIPSNSIIYCDPPYANTTGYKTGKFDHPAFWQWCEYKVQEGHAVFVSEYAAPEGWIDIWAKFYAAQLAPDRTKSKREQEKLFVHYQDLEKYQMLRQVSLWG